MKTKNTFISLALILGYFIIPTNSLAATVGCESIVGKWTGKIQDGDYKNNTVIVHIKRVRDEGSKRFYSVHGTISWTKKHKAVSLFPSSGSGSWCRQRDNKITSLLLQGLYNRPPGMEFISINSTSFDNAKNPQDITSNGFVIDGHSNNGQIVLRKPK